MSKLEIDYPTAQKSHRTCCVPTVLSKYLREGKTGEALFEAIKKAGETLGIITGRDTGEKNVPHSSLIVMIFDSDDLKNKSPI